MRATTNIRVAAVAGQFYPGDAELLARQVQALLAATAQPKSQDATPKALIVPHAGYIYSGPVAASAYARLRALRGTIQRVVLLGPVHRVPVRGLALPGTQAFETPLGQISIDREAVDRLRMRQITISAAAHALEHSLEVQLPFLQQVLGDFKIVPLAVGDATPEEVAEVIEALWGGPETLIVVSSDLSHYLPYQAAQHIDRQTCAAIARLQTLDSHEQACGAAPVNGLLLAARRHHLRPRLLDLRNSGDTAGDRERVVGYAAFAFSEKTEHAH